MIEKYLSLLQEVNYIISGGNKYYNIDKFKNDQNGKLFIVGLSGSGKTTLGQKLAKKYNAKYIKLDEMDRQWRKKYSEKLKKDMWDRDINKFVIQELNKFFENVMSNPGKEIIEGIHILYYNNNFFKDKAVIILGISLLLSSIRAYNRNFEKFHDRATRAQIVHDIYVNQKDFLKRLKQFEEVMDGE